MDSLTQIALGATLAAVIAPRAQRRRAVLYGAALGTLPDLDVLIDFGDPIADFTRHRSFSHSLFVLSVLAPLLWWCSQLLDSALRAAPRRWLLLFWLALVTHPLLDAMTIYGTQLLWPIDPTPWGVGSVFIIDPLYSLPLLVAMALAWWRPQALATARALPWALALSSAYLVWSVLAQRHVEAHARTALGAGQHQLLALPSAFNTLLWRVLVREPGGYREAYLSLLVDEAPGPWRRFPSADEWAPALAGQPGFERLRWFTRGFWALQRDGQQLLLTDLRMGSEPAYVFRFVVARIDGRNAVAVAGEQLPGLRGIGRAARWLIERVVTPGHALPPPDQILSDQVPAKTE